jgi:hypothetical protein
MLQAFVSNVSVVFPDACCKCVYLNVARVSHICCMCFILMLHIFCNDFFKRFQVFLQVFQIYVASVSTAFERISQMFHLNVSKVDRVLHLPPHLGVSSSRSKLKSLTNPKI